VHPLAQTAVVRVSAAKVEPVAEIGLSLLAHLATPAGLGRVNRYPRANRQWLKVAVQVVWPWPYGLNYPGKLVPQNQRALQADVANTGILVGVQVTAADTDGGYPQQDFAGSRWSWMG
jgi:hypothetical protein